MNISMINSLVGMHALQQKIDTIANNMSNINTIGYKSREAYFQEILTSRLEQPEDFALEGRMTKLGLDTGYGAKMSLTLANFSQGQRIETGISTDMMLTGDHIFFTIAPQTPFEDKELTYTRNGHFQLDANRNLVTDNGEFVLNTEGESIYIPEGMNFSISSEGRILAYNGENNIEEIGQLRITKINTPQVLEEVGNSKYRIPEKLIDEGINVIDPEFTMDGTNQYAVIQGSLENANIDLAKEMVQLNESLRAYQFMSRGLSISDQMLGIANNLKG